ncbi:hypothetical protein [Gordonia sp. 'Campus']|uniref:hypothetical protein n=1 Tax=Gordonia sp. 'Campus' TaxID=2915824 RepID=UPI001EE4C11E|nr:hypothetical protein [Gordonia sp. 'Campus']
MGTSSWLSGLGTLITKPGAAPSNNWLTSQWCGAQDWTFARDGPATTTRPAQTVVLGA